MAAVKAFQFTAVVGLSLFLPIVASAQVANKVETEVEDENAVTQARDAFGQRVGEESIGLYNENQVRGFDLNLTGSHRVDGAYFVKEFPIPDIVLDGARVNVGINAARLHFPSPSGIADFRLKNAMPGDRRLAANFGMRDYFSPFLEVTASYARDDGKAGIIGGFDLDPSTKWHDKKEGFTHGIGFVPHVMLSDKFRLRGLATVEKSIYNGNVNMVSATAALPPKLSTRFMGVPYGRNHRFSHTLGVLADGDLADSWSLEASLIRSWNRRTPQDFTLLSIRPDRTADVTYLRAILQKGESYAGESILTYRVDTEQAQHRFTVAGRGRDSQVVTESITPLRLGVVDLDDRNFPPEPVRGPATNGTNSHVKQYAGVLGYSGTFFNRFEVNGGVQRVRYAKDSTTFAGVTTGRVEYSWGYNASALFALTDATTVYASTVKGIEETGTAPQSALNRNEVLPPVTAKSYEIGVRQQINSTLSVSSSLFSVSKQTPGLRPDGIYALLGSVRHRGAEFSMAGRVYAGTTVVLGATWMEPRLSGPLVDSGAIGKRPVGVSAGTAALGVDHVLSFAPGWSVDTRVTWQSSRAANVINSYSTPAFSSLALGARYRFAVGGRPAIFRIVGSNLFTTRPWSVGPGGTLNIPAPVTLRASLRIEFDQDLK